MTRKDYIAIGQAIRAAFLTSPRSEPVVSVVSKVTLGIADVFEKDNPRFDRARFLRFVEIGEDKRA